MSYPNGIPVRWTKAGVRYDGYYVGRLHYHDAQNLIHEHACETTEGRVHIVRDDEFVSALSVDESSDLYDALCAAIREVMGL